MKKKTLRGRLSVMFLAVSLSGATMFGQAAHSQSSEAQVGFLYTPLGQSNIVIDAQNLNISNNQVSFVIDKRRINLISFLTARTGQIYVGAKRADRLCPIFRVANHNFTRLDQGHLRTVRVDVTPKAAAVIRRYQCVTLPDMRNLPR